MRVVLRVIESRESGLRKVIADLEEDGLVRWLVSVVEWAARITTYALYLNIFCKILTLPNLVTRCMTDQVALRVLVEMAKLHHNDEVLSTTYSPC